jgi:hypothetical protein
VQGEEWVDVNFDHLIGKSFSESIYKGCQSLTKTEDSDGIEVFQDSRRAGGYILIFGVNKADDSIKYWRVLSGPGTCKVTTRTSHINQ